MAKNKFADAIAEAASQTDMNEAVAGGAPPLPEGPCRLRFVGYIELGIHESEYNGKKSEKERARFIFEVTGPKIEPKEDGTPHFISLDRNKSQNENSGFFKLFKKLNYAGKAKHAAELLGEGYRGMITHNVKGEGADKRTFVNLTDSDGGYQIAPPHYDDPETGERKQVKIPAAVSPLMCFLWSFATKDMWDSIFIDGEWEAKANMPASSKNKHQIKIKEAVNWVGSPMQEKLFGDLDLGDVEKPDRTDEDKQKVIDQKAGVAEDDPLDDIPF